MAAVRPCMAAVLASMIWPVTSPQAYDVSHVGAAVVVDRERASLAELDPGRLEPEPLGVGPHADAQEHVRALDLAAVLEDQPHLVALLALDREPPGRS